MKKTLYSILSKYQKHALVAVMVVLLGVSASAQLGSYSFSGLLLATCPNNNNTVTTQPANATFSPFVSVGTTCVGSLSSYNNSNWNTGAAILLTQYNEFSITPDPGYMLNLTSLSFTHATDKSATKWCLRSSLDGFSSDLASGTVTATAQTPVITLPTTTFTNIGAVTFRIYLIGAQNGNTEWYNDNVSVSGSVVKPPNNPSNPSSNSPQCATPGVTLSFNGTPPAGESWFWQTAANGISTANSGTTFTAVTSGTYYLRARNNTTLIWSTGAGSVTVTITPAVMAPAFAMGASSIRCIGAGTTNYSATANNSTGITYTLDANSTAAGNTINAASGDVTFGAAWVGTSIITATATGCNGPVTADHTVTTNLPVTTPVFVLGSSSTRCQGAGPVTYSASANNTSGINYSLDAATLAAGNSINAVTGEVTYAAGWYGTSAITASAAGCGDPSTASHTVTITATVGAPVFAQGASSNRCVLAETVSYSATATSNTGITYSLDTASSAAGNSIDVNTGYVTFDAAWTGTSVITATATGCNGPTSSTHTVITRGPVTTPVFASGDSSVRCQGAGNVSYSGTANYTTGISYTLDANSISGSNSINATTGQVTFAAGWSGTSEIMATATGCFGPKTSVHVVTTTPTVGLPVFSAGATSSRCQGPATIVYDATATTTTGITYSLNTASLSAGNTIDPNTGEVTFAAGYSGTTIITASAAGCNGPRITTHTATVIATVGTPVFTLGTSTTRCQAANTVTYTANATTNTGINYTLDAFSAAAGNSINAATGAVTYDSNWFGTSVITATATGCNGPTSADHTVTITRVVGPVSFVSGSTSERCQGAGSATYTAIANYTTGITYTLDLNSRNNGNTINSTTGVVTYAAGWYGTSTITATAATCSPQTAIHVVTTIQTVGTPTFVEGNTSSRCQAANNFTYTASAVAMSAISYTLDATSLSAGNTINVLTGEVTWVAAWYGASTIIATAEGCSGPKSRTHTITTNAPVEPPVFTLGAASERCQSSLNVIYTATATHRLGNITYTLDLTSRQNGNTINATTGEVNWDVNWTGTSVVTASAPGCYGPQTSTHTITTIPFVTRPNFATATSTRCQGAGTATYPATANYTTGITYSLNAASLTAGNTINPNTGEVTYVATFAGTSTVTASAAGCSGPQTRNHVVTVTATVGTPVFTTGATTRCQGAGTVTYTATATTNTGISYALDALSVAGGNTINTATGAVTYSATWIGTTVITATATGCNGPSTASRTVTVTPTVGAPVYDIGTTSVRCQGAGAVTYSAAATNSTGVTYSLDAASITGSNTINASTGVVTYVAGWAGTSTITASAAGCNGPKTSTHSVTITPTVGAPVFALGATSSRCQVAGVVTYSATATNTTGITYSLDASSLAAGNTINVNTGSVTYDANWFGTSVITASAAGCNGPRTSNHTVTTNAPVTVPVFSIGAISVRCQGNNSVTYTATANNISGLTYALDAQSLAGGNTINTNTGAVTYAAVWTGSSVITATATGCYGPQTQTHTVTITPTVGLPVFSAGTSSTRCQAAGNFTYTASSTNNTGITYSLDATSTSAGNTINTSTGEVSYVTTWSGTSIITATATGCNGPRSATHSVATSAPVTTPVFSLGATSTRCQAGASVTYVATANNTTGITYSIDANSIAAGNTINSSTGALTYTAGWSGTSVISASAAGCYGPLTATHTVTITPSVGTPFFALGSTSTRCNGSGTVTYTATATTNTGITYSLDASSISAGNSINTSTGTITYIAGWVGTAIITARATGCNGPVTSTHRAASTPSVATPVFSLGGSSTRCQGAGNVTYTASATNSTSIVYSLDGTSLSNGNTINADNGVVTYVADWVGTSTITATAYGCNGPTVATHTVTVTPNGTPAFVLGPNSTRLQSAANVSYTANANNGTVVSYTLDAASIAGGNTIDATAGVVTFHPLWVGFSEITATATGCNGTVSASHIVMSASSTVTKQLYLSDPAQSLDRIDPVATGDATTSTTNTISTTGSTVAVENATSNSGTGNTVTVSHVTGSAPDRLMLVGISYSVSANPTIQYVTYGGTLLTQVGTVQADAARAVAIYRLLSPETGFANVVVNFDVPTNGAVVGVTTYSGVNQITPLNTFSSAFGNNSNPSLAVNSAANEVVFGIVAANNSLTSPSGTPRWNIAQGGLYGAGTTQVGSPISNVTYTLGGFQFGRAWVMSGVSIKPASGSSLTFTQNPPMCSPLVIKSNALIVTTYVSITSGTMPAAPSIDAVLRYGASNIITLSNPTYNSTLNTLTWSGATAGDVTIPAGEAVSLDIVTAEPGVAFNIKYDSQTQPSKIDLPVSTYIDINSLEVFDAPYPSGNIVNASVLGTTRYVRATVSDPFGYDDITALTMTISPSGGTITGTSVAGSGCIRTYEYVWNPTSGANYNLVATAKEGFENMVSATRSVNFTFCADCPPVAVNDSATGAGGSPIIIDVLSNDYDPNNNINQNSIVIVSQPQNGDAVVSGGKVVYLPNGTFAGNDQFTYRICDLTSPTPLCSTAKVFVSIDPTIVDPCSEASRSHIYFIPFPEEDTRTALIQSTGPPGYIPIPSNNIRTIISLKILYPNMTIVWDHWEDGYESDITNSSQSSTKVWGDGNPYNGIAPGYPTDIIPPGGSIVLDNTIPAFPRVPANIFYDGRDKIYSSGQITLTQVSGEPSIIEVQCMKTNVSSVDDFGKSFTIPVGENFNSRDFRYTALFIRAAEDSTIVNIDKDKNGTFELVDTLQQGQSLLVNGGVLTGATITSDKPVGVDLHFGGVDGYSSREVPIYPATWYSNVYYSPVPTTGGINTIKDTAAVMLYNNLNRPISINWSSGVPSSGTINLPAKTAFRFPLPLSTTAGYKFVNPTGESFTAIEIVDSYTPGSGANSGSTFDWAFNLISEERLTTFAAIAWAPGSTDGTRNDNPIWVTPANTTTIYVKYDGDVLNGGSVSPCGLRYDVSYPLSNLKHKRLLDNFDNNQSGLAVYTCDGTKLAAVYGEDPSTAVDGNPSWDVGSTIRPYCATKLILASDDNAYTLTDRPVTIQILNNDGGFTAVVDPNTVSTTGYLLQPKNGTVTVNPNGTLLYTPNIGFIGYDTLEYRVCSMPSPVVCDVATVVILVNACPTPSNKNIISGRVFLDINKDGVFNDDNSGVNGAIVYLYADGNCNSVPEANELKDSMVVDKSGSYQFIAYPENTVSDDFDNNGVNTCASGSDGTKPWRTNWVDTGDPSIGFCVTPAQSYTNTNAEIVYDYLFNTHALRVKNPSVSATRTIDLNGANSAFISFSYRKAAALANGKNITVQVSSNGSSYATIFTISGNGTKDPGYVDVHNQEITSFASSATYIRILTSPNMTNSDTVFIDNISITYLKYPLCYITKVEPTSVSSDYYFSTASQNAMVATSGGTCLFPFDFGLAKKYISISGNVYNDVNGIADNLVSGTPTGAPAGNTIYAYLVDTSGKSAFKTTVNSLTGAYAFTTADVNTNFTVLLSTTDSPLYRMPPSAANLPEGWVSVGETYGLSNIAGAGIKTGTSDSRIKVNTGLVPITKVDFGIEILPDAGRGKNSAPNPGGEVSYTLPANTFNNIFTSTDASPGTVTRIRITGFPDKVVAMAINGIDYNRSNFPAGGVVVPTTTTGLPTQTIALNPDDGYVKAVIPYYAVDNAGRESVLPGEAVMTFSVDTDKDGVIDTDDIDDDNDGITDFIETCGFGATTFSCLPGGSDPTLDEDNDGTINHKDADWSPLNSAGTAAILDADGDGIPDYLDLDSDNDGLADVIEAGGVDANGDGIIDNYCDTDVDGLSQNVDANNTGKAGSAFGLGFVDFDADGVPNTNDLDSDNDGIPDITESYGTDSNNDGRVDTYLDSDSDGWTNQYDGDADGNAVVENLAGVLILSNSDAAYVSCSNPGTGRPTGYTIRGNTDNQGLPNFLDLDSDGDGITDASESGITAASYTRGMVASCTLVKGWCTSVSSLASLNLRNTDNLGKANPYDIDSDNDGITDNIEGQPTGSFVVSSATDADADGIADSYDSFNGIGGNGITPYDHDGDGLADYLDLDTDNDGATDRNEGDTRNLGLTQATIDASGDVDGDGLMDHFDTYDVRIATNASSYLNISMSQMGPLGNYHGPTPSGSKVQLVQSSASAPNRDWRHLGLLPLQIVNFNGSLQNKKGLLNWKVENEQAVEKYIVERSSTGLKFEPLSEVQALNSNNVTYRYTDNLETYPGTVVYYRIQQVSKNGEKFYTQIIRFTLTHVPGKVKLYPNPVRDVLNVSISSATKQTVDVSILDASGKAVIKQTYKISQGSNTLQVYNLNALAKGLYLVQVKMVEETITEKISIQ